MKKILSVVALLFLIFSCSKLNDSTYTILTVNSMNGQIFPKQSNGTMTGGFSLLSTQVQQLRDNEDNGKIVLVGNSNFIYGKVEAYFTTGKAVIDLMNELKFDALVLGHREFYFGFDVLKDLSAKAKFPFISANIVKKDSSRYDFIKPYIILEDKKTAIIGLSTDKIIDANLEKDVKDILYLNIENTVRKYIDVLKNKGISKIILIGDFQCAPKETKHLASEFVDILESGDVDILIGTSSPDGRDDKECICNNIKNSRILSADIKGKELHMYKFTGSEKYETVRIFDINSKYLKPDERLAKMLSDLNILVKETAGEVLGYSEEEIPHLQGNTFDRESKLGDLISDIMREYTKTDVMLLNSGKIRNGFRKGPVTLMDLYNILPYEGTLVKLSMTGKQILQLIESSCALKMTKSFLQVSGISFKFDSGSMAGKRVVKNSVYVNGSKLDPEKRYSVSVTKYMFNGGDKYDDFSKMEITPEMIYQKQMREILKEYIISNKKLVPRIYNRIVDIAK